MCKMLNKINMKFGRLNKNRLVDFAPAGMPNEWYPANGWLPIETV